jgi:hypothetical protein
LYDPFCKSKQSLWQVAEKRLEGEQNWRQTSFDSCVRLTRMERPN